MGVRETDILTRHRKPTTDENGRQSSPRKTLAAVTEDENFGTIF